MHLYTPRLRQTLQQLDRTKCTTQVSAHLCEYLQATCYESCRSARVVVALTPRPELGGAVGATTNLRTLERWNGEKMASVNELDFYFCKLTPQSAIWRSRAIVNQKKTPLIEWRIVVESGLQ